MGISVQTLWVLVFRGVNDLPVEGSFRRNDPSLTNRIPNGSNGSTKTAASWVFGYGKPPWETAAETLWETDVWYLLCPRMDFTAMRSMGCAVGGGACGGAFSCGVAGKPC